MLKLKCSSQAGVVAQPGVNRFIFSLQGWKVSGAPNARAVCTVNVYKHEKGTMHTGVAFLSTPGSLKRVQLSDCGFITLTRIREYTDACYMAVFLSRCLIGLLSCLTLSVAAWEENSQTEADCRQYIEIRDFSELLSRAHSGECEFYISPEVLLWAFSVHKKWAHYVSLWSLYQWHEELIHRWLTIL